MLKQEKLASLSVLGNSSSPSNRTDVQDQLEAAAAGLSRAVSQALALGSQMLPLVACAWAFLHSWASKLPQKPASWWSSCSRKIHLARAVKEVM